MGHARRAGVPGGGLARGVRRGRVFFRRSRSFPNWERSRGPAGEQPRPPRPAAAVRGATSPVMLVPLASWNPAAPAPPPRLGVVRRGAPGPARRLGEGPFLRRSRGGEAAHQVRRRAGVAERPLPGPQGEAQPQDAGGVRQREADRLLLKALRQDLPARSADSARRARHRAQGRDRRHARRGPGSHAPLVRQLGDVLLRRPRVEAALRR